RTPDLGFDGPACAECPKFRCGQSRFRERLSEAGSRFACMFELAETSVEEAPPAGWLPTPPGDAGLEDGDLEGWSAEELAALAGPDDSDDGDEWLAHGVLPDTGL